MKTIITGWIAALLVIGSITCAGAQEITAPQPLKPEELEQLVAPIALYPDNLLSQVMIASTYPLEVVEADRWVRGNTNLEGEARAAVLNDQGWDDSVKSLTTTPEVLNNMSQKLDWTQKLGDAVLAQQKDVMDAVQRLRTKAYAQKTLQSTPQQTVETRVVEDKEVIVIQSAEPDTVYVPYYDPTVVYGAWAYPSYPPVYYPPPSYALARGIAFGVGVAIVAGIWNNNDCDWGHGDINVNVNKNFNNFNKTKWTHKPEHRRGVQYRDHAARQKFDQNRTQSREALRGTVNQRESFRGREQGQVSRPSGRDYSRANDGRVQQANFRESGRGGNAFSNIGNGNATRAQANRGRASFASHGGARRGGGGFRR